MLAQRVSEPVLGKIFRRSLATARPKRRGSMLKRDACLDDLAENRVGLLLLERAERKLFRRGQARFNFQKFAIRDFHVGLASGRKKVAIFFASNY